MTAQTNTLLKEILEKLKDQKQTDITNTLLKEMLEEFKKNNIELLNLNKYIVSVHDKVNIVADLVDEQNKDE